MTVGSGVEGLGSLDRSWIECAGCGYRPSTDEPYPFACAMAGVDDVDHLLVRRLDCARVSSPRALFLAPETNPFLRYRRLLHSYHVAIDRGLTDTDYVDLVQRLDGAFAVADRREVGLRTTPFGPMERLGETLGLAADALWVKDETGNVTGSHKPRHLMGLMIWLEVAAATGLVDPLTAPPPLAIASCGNAALAAAAVAATTSRQLDVFVPPHADTHILERIEALGGRLHPCPRERGVAGDPCFRSFREAVAAGSLPFTCQGSTNGLTIEGGETLAWELVSEILRRRRALDRLFVQVGGGALASACIQGLQEAHEMGLLPRMPQVHAVQSEGAAPLARAWALVAARILGNPVEEEDPGARLRAAPGPAREAAFRHAATHRSEYMWPWEEVPVSIAGGILDDETYDWLAVVRGMVETGGSPVVVDEETLIRANELARRTTDTIVDHTGSAGLAGLLHLRGRGVVGSGETVALLFTGRERKPTMG